METSESDDDTLEFEIEVVESSSSISLASASAAETASIQITCQKVVDQQTDLFEQLPEKGEEEEVLVEGNKKTDSIPCEDSKEIAKIQESENVEKKKEALEIQPIDDVVNENVHVKCGIGHGDKSTSHRMVVESCESESPEKEAQTLKESTGSEEHLIKDEQQVCEFSGQSDNLGKKEISRDETFPQVDAKQEMINEANSNLDEVGNSHLQDGAVDRNIGATPTFDTLRISRVELTFPNDQLNADDDDAKIAAEQNKLAENTDTSLNGIENEADQRVESKTADKSEPEEAKSCQQFTTVSLDGSTEESHDKCARLSALPAPVNSEDSHLQPPVSVELVEAKRELINESIYPNGINSGVESELVSKLVASFTEEAECIERYSKQQEAEVDRKPSILENNIVLEVIEHSSDQTQHVDNVSQRIESDVTETHGLSLDQIKQATQKRRVSFGGGISRSASNFSVTTCGEDLEQEFDNEPVFERRQVEVKRNRNVRDEYELGEELGRGRFGTVRKCVEKCENGRELAAKFVNMRRREDREDVEREVYIMSLLQHKRLLQLYDAFDNGKDEMCLITELIEGGELFERIIDDDFDLTEKKAAIFMRQICQGVEYMHSQQVVHLDMKPENILCVSKTGNRIKLIDFGLARQLNLNESLRVMFGTPDFAAPEVLAYDIVSFATDMWSVGVICYVLLSGLSPFMGNNDIETMANVTKATYDFDDKAFEPISDLAKDFISKLLVREQGKRLKPNECLQHPWLQRGGIQLEANIRSRRESMVISMLQNNTTNNVLNETILASNLEQHQQLLNDNGDIVTPPLLLSLDKRNLKKYVIRRKWHKTVHAIMALGRMGANLKF